LLSYILKEKTAKKNVLLGYYYDARGAEMKPQYQKTFDSSIKPPALPVENCLNLL
jgi:hypothetical protein